jgi:hypothetical protein
MNRGYVLMKLISNGGTVATVKESISYLDQDRRGSRVNP